MQVHLPLSYPRLAQVNIMKETIRLALDSARTVDENGFLHVRASHITKATVNPYRGAEVPDWREHGLDPDKVYYAFRDPEELKKSLPTWGGLPLQFEHHPEGADEKEARFTRVGTVGTDVKWNAPYIDAPLTIWEQDAIDAIKDGQCRELSCAYMYEPDFTPGTYQGEHYDFVMRQIRGNHVALVPEGRAGRDVIVADCQIQKSGDLNMKQRTARDADPAIEKKEVEIGAAMEKAGQALQDLHEDVGGEFVDKGEAPATDDGLDAIKEKYKLDDAAIAEIKAALAPAADCDPSATDEDTEEQAADGDEETAVDEEQIIKDAMEGCGLDFENEELRDAFKQGLNFGEKKDEEETPPPAADDDEPMQEEIKAAEDRAFVRAVKYMQNSYKAKARAADKVAPLVGRLDHMSFDSAAGIYGYALSRAGVNIKGRKPSEYEAVLDGYMSAKFPKVSRARAGAQDSKGPSDGKLASLLNNIRIED